MSKFLVHIIVSNVRELVRHLRDGRKRRKSARFVTKLRVCPKGEFEVQSEENDFIHKLCLTSKQHNGECGHKCVFLLVSVTYKLPTLLYFTVSEHI